MVLSLWVTVSTRSSERFTFVESFPVATCTKVGTMSLAICFMPATSCSQSTLSFRRVITMLLFHFLPFKKIESLVVRKIKNS